MAHYLPLDRTPIGHDHRPSLASDMTRPTPVSAAEAHTIQRTYVHHHTAYCLPLPGVAPGPPYTTHTASSDHRSPITSPTPCQRVSPSPTFPSSTSSLSMKTPATTAGAVASHRDQQKRIAYARVQPHGYSFVPFSVETYGPLGQPVMKLLLLLGDKAAGSGGVMRASFVKCALRELSVGLCRSSSCLIEHLLACWLGQVAPASGLT
jgi:hypothetical protein